MAYKRKSKSKSKKSVAQIVTEQILGKLDKGEIPWRKPWTVVGGCPRSIRNKPYRGANTILLGMTGRPGPWLTYKEAERRGGHVKKGEKGSFVVFFKFLDKQTKDKQTGEIKKDRIPLMRYYKVFSLEQCEGVSEPKWLAQARAKVETNTHTPIEQAEALWAAYEDKPKVEHGSTRACYAPFQDKISMPVPESFDSPSHYYSTLYHEGVHSTGHESRTGRLEGFKAVAPFGSEDYSKEELVAEIGSAMLAAHAGIDCPDVERNTVAYLQNWSKKLRDDPNLFTRACSLAQKAVDYMIGHTLADEEEED